MRRTSPETRAKIGAAIRHKYESDPEYRSRVDSARRATAADPAVRAKISATLKVRNLAIRQAIDAISALQGGEQR